MACKTKIIAIEGIDGSGKTLQADRVAQALLALGYTVGQKSFPEYQSFFGKQVGNLLGGEKLRADEIDSKSMCLWYALDRWNSFKTYTDGEFDYLIINRYALSNAVYQSIRQIDLINQNPDVREDNWAWVKQLEYAELNLPEPDAYVVLDVEQSFAQSNVDLKGARDYVDGRDVYEQQAGLLMRARARYAKIAETENNIHLINCMQASQILSPDAIFEKIWTVLREIGLLNSSISESINKP